MKTISTEFQVQRLRFREAYGENMHCHKHNLTRDHDSLLISFTSSCRTSNYISLSTLECGAKQDSANPNKILTPSWRRSLSPLLLDMNHGGHTKKSTPNFYPKIHEYFQIEIAHIVCHWENVQQAITEESQELTCECEKQALEGFFVQSSVIIALLSASSHFFFLWRI